MIGIYETINLMIKLQAVATKDENRISEYHLVRTHSLEFLLLASMQISPRKFKEDENNMENI